MVSCFSESSSFKCQKTYTSEKEYLLKHTEESLYVGLNEIKPGARIGDIGAAIEEYAKHHHLGVVKELVGHGVGSHLHEDPEVPNYGKRNTGPVLKEGMVIAVEPMLNLGTAEVFILDDDWTIVTEDALWFECVGVCVCFPLCKFLQFNKSCKVSLAGSGVGVRQEI